jgi:hypothetical protein
VVYKTDKNEHNTSMSLEYFEIVQMRKQNPAWRLMTAENAPLIASFFDRVFLDENIRVIPESELTMLLEDYLYSLRDLEGEETFPRSASEYLADWSRNDKGWLRKFYPPGESEAHFDLTPEAEKAVSWISTLFARDFIGTESRLHSSIDLLRQIVNGVQQDKKVRLKELKKQRKEINAEIKAVEEGRLKLLDSREVKERFIQFSRMARELLSDFRLVEHNFRELDRSVREQIARWSGEKGGLLDLIFGKHDAITDSDEGKSFRAFWDFLMSSSGQDELSDLLDRVHEMDDLFELSSDKRLKRIHFDWMRAGEQTQRTVARLSQQLRRYLDDKAYLENKRIIEILDNIEEQALEVKKAIPKGSFMEIDSYKADISLPMERPLFTPPEELVLDSSIEIANLDDLESDALYNQIVVDKQELKEQIKIKLRDRSQTSLPELFETFPLRHGLSEVIAYLSIAETEDFGFIEDQQHDRIYWSDDKGKTIAADIPRVIFQKSSDKKSNEIKQHTIKGKQ